MTQEQKDLLLKDLCARLPYEVKISIPDLWSQKREVEILDEIFNGDDGLCRVNSKGQCIEYVKPYLFPLSSMTEEQYYEMQNISGEDCLEHMEVEKEWRNNSTFNHLPLYQHRVIEFFHKHHFDYRGLIPMGLAIDATDKNIY